MSEVNEAGTSPAAHTLDALIAKLADEHAPMIVALRQRIHQNPELSNREYQTAALVASHLRTLKLELREGVAHTGVVAILEGGADAGSGALAKPLVAVRADMDALPVTEASGYPYSSEVRAVYNGAETGVAHACGHDVHTAVLLGVASVLSELRDHLAGDVMFIFQPAEEGAPAGEEGGAKLMLKEGIFADRRVDAVLGLHSSPDLNVGETGFIVGPMMASATAFRAVIRGRQAHGARPAESIDPVVMAAQAVMGFQTIVSRNIAPIEAAVVTVGVVRGGTRVNIIPAEVVLEGTVRTFSTATAELIKRRMHEILHGVVGAAGGGSYTLEFDDGYPVTVNEPELAVALKPALERVCGREGVVSIQPSTGAEDFGFFAMEVPGFFFRLGTRLRGGYSGGLHTPDFLADDSAVPFGIRVLSTVTLDALARAARSVQRKEQK